MATVEIYKWLSYDTYLLTSAIAEFDRVTVFCGHWARRLKQQISNIKRS